MALLRKARPQCIRRCRLLGFWRGSGQAGLATHVGEFRDVGDKIKGSGVRESVLKGGILIFAAWRLEFTQLAV